MTLSNAVGSESPVPCPLWPLLALLNLLLALLVCSGCGQATARQSAPDHASTVIQVADEQRAAVVTEQTHVEPAIEQSTTAPLLFADERIEPYQPRGPPGLVVLPFFPAPLILPADLKMPGELGVVVERVVRGQHVVAWAAISPVGWRVGAVRTVGFRYYNPITGRYISRDPLGYPNGLNNYLYVNNNPINRIDPLGLGWEEYWQGVKDTFKGEGMAVVGLVTGVATMIAHPIDTAKGIGTAVAHPIDTVKAIGHDIAEKADSDQGRGELVGDLLLTFTPAGMAKRAAQIEKSAKVAEETAKVAKVAKVAEAAAIKSAQGEVKALTETAKIEPPSRGYDRPEIETKSGKAVKESEVTKDWDDFLGQKQTKVDPRDGLPDPDRIWSADGQRSIRYGDHEMGSKPSKQHYHRETWYDTHVDNDLQRYIMGK